MRVRHGVDRRLLVATPMIFLAVLASISGCQSNKVHTATVDTSSVASEPATATSATSAEPTTTDPVGSSTVHITWKPRSVGGKAFAPALAGYQAFVATTMTLEGDPNPKSPQIAKVAAGQAQQDLVRVLQDLVSSGHTRHGSVTMRPLITAADPAAGTATIDDCADFSHFFEGKESKPAAGAQRRPLEAKLSAANGNWQVTSFTQGGAVACTGES